MSIQNTERNMKNNIILTSLLIIKKYIILFYIHRFNRLKHRNVYDLYATCTRHAYTHIKKSAITINET